MQKLVTMSQQICATFTMNRHKKLKNFMAQLWSGNKDVRLFWLLQIVLLAKDWKDMVNLMFKIWF